MNEVLLSDAIATLKKRGSNSIPLIITDPPYGIGYHSNHYKGRNPHAPINQDWDFKIGTFLKECSRTLRDGGALYLFCRWDVSPLWIPAIQGTDLKLKTVIIWVKDNWSAGDLTGSFGNQYEQILFITKGRHTLRGKRWSNVWNFPRVPAKCLLHPAQKPTALLERAICSSSDPGDLVCDFYAGSGSTAEACQRTGRDYLLCDIDKKMVSLSRRRLGLPDDLIEDAEGEPEQTPYILDTSSDDWNIDPEQIAEVYALLKQNREQLFQKVSAIPLSLWTTDTKQDTEDGSVA